MPDINISASRGDALAQLLIIGAARILWSANGDPVGVIFPTAGDPDDILGVVANGRLTVFGFFQAKRTYALLREFFQW